MIRVLLVEDDPVICEYLRARLALEPDLQLVDACPDALSALGRLVRTAVDVVLLDYHLQRCTGVQFLQHLSLLAADGVCRPAVLLCSGRADPEVIAAAREWGAAGVLSKTDAAGQLLPALRAVAAGRSWPDDAGDPALTAGDRNAWRARSKVRLRYPFANRLRRGPGRG